MTLLLGIDEGTSAVKAVLFDADLRPLAEARREKPLAYPRAGLGRAGSRGGARRRGRRRRRAARASPPGRVTACGLDHQGESVLAWDAETRRAAHPDRHLAGQALPGGARPARGDRPRRGGHSRAAACRSTPTSRPGKLAWLLEHDASRPARARGRDAAHRHRRLVPVRSARRRLRHRPLDRVAHAARRCRDWDPVLLDDLRRARASVLPAIADTAGRARRAAPRRPGRVELPLRARVRRPAGGAGRRRAASRPGSSRPPTAPACSCSPTPATERRRRGGGPAADRRLARATGAVEWALDGGVFTAGALLEWLSRDLGLAADPRGAGRAPRRRSRTRGGVRVLPALAGVGAPWWQPDARAVIAGLTAGARPAHIARAALEGDRLAGCRHRRA